MGYFAWDFKPTGTDCVLEEIQNVDNPFDLSSGIQLAESFPKDASFVMNPSFPKNVRLSDNISNLEDLPLVSKRLREFIEAKAPSG
ncbi:MAG: hypothetical protein H7X80_06505, partial [bacterium]|nr:hypothetical protein [Candidatus Kapabacteria bacterium]